MMGWVQNLEYVVEREGAHWTISFQEAPCGRFGSRRDAMAAAVGDAQRVRRLGHRVRVLVRHLDGRLRCVPEQIRPLHQPTAAPPAPRATHRR